jgi:CDP-alcohol phosphatidyltransferase-like enzyme
VSFADPHRAPARTSPADDVASKGSAVEEWVDLHFFRPIGVRIARALQPTRVSPDQVTLWSLIIGLAAGHCFVYASPWVNVLGFALFIVSDLFDSADGQLARLRGTSTRFGRILDGLSDNARFVNLYAHVVVRLVHHDGWSVVAALTLALLAGASHSWQSAAIDCIRHAYLELGTGAGSELELSEDLAMPDDEAPVRGILRRLGAAAYRAYVQRQTVLCPITVKLVRRVRELEVRGDVEQMAELRASYRARQRGVVRQCAWLGQNIRFPLVGVPGALGAIAYFLWLTVLPLNVILVALLVTHERHAAAFLSWVDGAVPPVSKRLGTVPMRR